MQRASAVWHKWLRWLRARAAFDCKCPARPPSVAFAVFTQHAAKGVPTAVDGVLKSSKWTQRHLGIHALPLDSPFLRPPLPAVLKQAPELPLEIWTHLIIIASSGSDNLGLLASLVLYTGALCLRSKHAQRQPFMRESCTHRILMGKVVRGKRRGRRAFYNAGPTCAAPWQ